MRAFNLPDPEGRITADLLRGWARVLRQADRQNVKRNTDIHLGQARVVLTAPDGGKWAIEVDNAGNLSASSYTVL